MSAGHGCPGRTARPGRGPPHGGAAPAAQPWAPAPVAADSPCRARSAKPPVGQGRPRRRRQLRRPVSLRRRAAGAARAARGWWSPTPSPGPAPRTGGRPPRSGPWSRVSAPSPAEYVSSPATIPSGLIVGRPPPGQALRRRYIGTPIKPQVEDIEKRGQHSGRLQARNSGEPITASMSTHGRLGNNLLLAPRCFEW